VASSSLDIASRACVWMGALSAHASHSLPVLANHQHIAEFPLVTPSRRPLHSSLQRRFSIDLHRHATPGRAHCPQRTAHHAVSGQPPPLPHPPPLQTNLFLYSTQAVIRVASCRRQVGVFLLTRSDSEYELGASELFTMEVQKLKQQQQQQQQVSATCSCQPQHPWGHTASPLFSTSPSAASHRHLPYITGVLITPMSSTVSVGSAASACTLDPSAVSGLQALATEWEVLTATPPPPPPPPRCHVAHERRRSTSPSKTTWLGGFVISPKCTGLLHSEERRRLSLETGFVAK
jgi:hypothetical protein